MTSKKHKTSGEEMPPIPTFVFLNLQTTSLLDEPDCRITELCMIAVNKNDLGTEELPRVMNKMVICLNPGKAISDEATCLSGLSHDMLKSQRKRGKHTEDLICNFLRHLSKPICFLSHYGNGFHFPLFRAKIRISDQSLRSDLLCADTLQAFKSLEVSKPRRLLPSPSNPQQNAFIEMRGVTDDTVPQKSKKRKSIMNAPEQQTKKPKHSGNHTSTTTTSRKESKISSPQSTVLRSTPLTRQEVAQKISYKLEDIYERHFDKPYPGPYTAEDKCIKMLKIAKRYPKFPGWVEKNAVPFSYIKPAAI